jgi:PAS domain S-box-containing protein
MSKAAYQRFFTSLPVPALVVDSLAFIQQANERASDLLDLSHEPSLQHKSMLLYLNPESRRRLQWCLAQRNHTGMHEMLDVQLNIDEGYVLPCNIHITRLDAELDVASYDGQMSLLVILDQSPVQAQRLSEERYRQQTQRLGEVIWASQSGVWEWEMSNPSLICNARWAEIQGYTLDELLPITMDDWVKLVHPDDQAAVLAIRTQLQHAQADTFDHKIRLTHKLGGWIWVQHRGRVIERDEDHKPERVAGALVDISNEMAQAHALEAAKLAAEEAQRINSEFMANLGHEIRTPLNSVLGLIELLENTPLQPQQKELLHEMHDSSALLRNTLNELLDNAKLEAGGVELEQTPIELRELLGSTMVLFTRHAKEAGIGLSARIAPDVPEAFLGDALRLQQVLNNLVSNAIKFTSVGRVDINITRLQQNIDGQVELMVEVQDTGIGIKPGDQPRLFTPFFQSDSSITRRFGGTGLGLSICKRLVTLMGGSLGVESTPGVGSRFWFTANFKLLDTQASSAPASKPSEWHVEEARSATQLPLLLDTHEQRKQLQTLAQALKKHDIKAIEITETLMRYQDQSKHSVLTTIKSKLDAYDFLGALDVLNAVSVETSAS